MVGGRFEVTGWVRDEGLPLAIGGGRFIDLFASPDIDRELPICPFVVRASDSLVDLISRESFPVRLRVSGEIILGQSGSVFVATAIEPDFVATVIDPDDESSPAPAFVPENKADVSTDPSLGSGVKLSRDGVSLVVRAEIIWPAQGTGVRGDG